MKKICLCLYLIIFNLAFSQIKSLSTIKNLEFVVNEMVKFNNKETEKKYNIVYELPNKIKKEIIFPKMNKGEIYIYNNGVKTIYLPIFDEYKESKIDKEENQIIQAVNKIIDLEKSDKKFKKTYLAKKEQSVFLDEQTKITIKKYVEVGAYLLPKEIVIEDYSNNIVGNIILDEIKVNEDIKEDIFILGNKGKK